MESENKFAHHVTPQLHHAINYIVTHTITYTADGQRTQQSGANLFAPTRRVSSVLVRLSMTANARTTASSLPKRAAHDKKSNSQEKLFSNRRNKVAAFSFGCRHCLRRTRPRRPQSLAPPPPATACHLEERRRVCAPNTSCFRSAGAPRPRRTPRICPTHPTASAASAAAGNCTQTWVTSREMRWTPRGSSDCSRGSSRAPADTRGSPSPIPWMHAPTRTAPAVAGGWWCRCCSRNCRGATTGRYCYRCRRCRRSPRCYCCPYCSPHCCCNPRYYHCSPRPRCHCSDRCRCCCRGRC
mmetsp:Transcript_30723/g.76418  ORF Transcript_30723/g.76418 Transcript_30723/m.76418 type:complete len:297 (+) Transcript_30723:937-1827(+)